MGDEQTDSNENQGFIFYLCKWSHCAFCVRPEWMELWRLSVLMFDIVMYVATNHERAFYKCSQINTKNNIASLLGHQHHQLKPTNSDSMVCAGGASIQYKQLARVHCCGYQRTTPFVAVVISHIVSPNSIKQRRSRRRKKHCTLTEMARDNNWS